jgi:hypothetical protein
MLDDPVALDKTLAALAAPCSGSATKSSGGGGSPVPPTPSSAAGPDSPPSPGATTAPAGFPPWPYGERDAPNEDRSVRAAGCAIGAAPTTADLISLSSWLVVLGAAWLLGRCRRRALSTGCRDRSRS